MPERQRLLLPLDQVVEIAAERKLPNEPSNLIDVAGTKFEVGEEILTIASNPVRQALERLSKEQVAALLAVGNDFERAPSSPTADAVIGSLGDAGLLQEAGESDGEVELTGLGSPVRVVLESLALGRIPDEKN